MVKIEGTNTLKEKIIEEADKKNMDPDPEELKQFETESIMRMQEKAKLALKTAIGNERLAFQTSNIPIQECKFQPESKIVRYATDIAGDPDIKKIIEENKALEKKMKMMKAKKLQVVQAVATVDESNKIFEKKKGKEKEKFHQRNVIPAWRPEKLEKASKSYMIKDVKEKKTEGKLEQYKVDFIYPQYVNEGHYEKK